MENQDILNRQPFIDNIISLLDTLSKDTEGCAFAIDGAWGIGKSFVLDQLEKQIEDYQSEETSDSRFFIFHYNCWQYDYYTEPAVAIISAMLDKANCMTSTKLRKKATIAWRFAKNVLKDVSGNFIKNKIGIDVVDIANRSISEETRREIDDVKFDEWFSFKDTIEKARNDIQKIADEKTVLIVVDEIDRCLPEYAIKVLERLHHLFDGLSNVIVMFAIDSRQLRHSVEMIYGQGTDVDKYLKKFISFKLDLDNGSVQESIFKEYYSYFSMFENKHFNDIDDVKRFVRMLLNNAELDIRRKKKAFDLICTIHKMISTEKQDYSVMIFELLVVFFSISRNEENRKQVGVLANIDTANYAALDKEIGKTLYDFLREEIINRRKSATHAFCYGREFFACSSSVMVAVYVLKEIYSDNNYLGDKDPKRFENEVKTCVEFEKYRTLLV